MGIAEQLIIRKRKNILQQLAQKNLMENGYGVLGERKSMTNKPKIVTIQKDELEDPWQALRKKPGVTIQSEAVRDGR